MTAERKDRGPRKDYKLPIAIVKGGKDVEVGKTVQLFQDQIDRIESASKAAKKLEG